MVESMTNMARNFLHGGLLFHAINVSVWAFVLWAIFWTPVAPVEFTGGDSVFPSRVKAGDIVNVQRNFHVHRAGSVNITRVMVQGDCAKKCDLIDLPSSSRYFGPVGQFQRNTRPLKIPESASAGEWKLQFTLMWDDRWGRAHEVRMPELAIEVIDK